MKKFAFTLALALICLLSAAQQPHNTLKESMQHGLSIEQIEKSVQNRLVFTQRFDSLVDIYDNGKTVIRYAYDDHARLVERIKETHKTIEIYVVNSCNRSTYVYDENDNCLLNVEYGLEGDEWREYDKTEYSYDANGNCLSKITYDYGIPYQKLLWTYDENNCCLTEEFWEYMSDNWKTSYRHEYAYDAHGNKILYIRQGSNTFDSWKNISKEEYSYDANDNMTLLIRFHWYSGWDEEKRIAYTYDANNNLITMETVEEYPTKTEYTYDEANRLILSISMYDNYGSWEKISKTEYKYDQNDSLLLEAQYGPSNELDWGRYKKVEYVRNEAGFATSETYARGSVSGYDWIYGDRYRYEYDDCNQMISSTYLKWSNTAGDFAYIEKEAYELDENGNAKGFYFYKFQNDEWVLKKRYENTFDLTTDASIILGLPVIYYDLYVNLPILRNPVQNKWLSSQYFDVPYEGEHNITLYYSDFYDVAENESSSLKVYSSDGTLSIENDNIADIQVFDMLGRLVAQQNQVAQCKFNLTPGVYVVKASNASVKAVVK